MSKLKKIFAVALMAMVAFSMSACSGGMNLYINAKAGDSYKYHLVSNTASTYEANGEEITSTQEMTTDYVINVKDVDAEGNVTMDYKYDALKMSAESEGVVQSFDSKSPDLNDPTAKIYNSLIGNGFSVKMTKFGEIKEIDGVDALLDSMVDSFDLEGAEETEELKTQLKETLKQSFGSEALISMLEQSTNIYPQKEVKVGDSWETKYGINAIIQMEVTVKYTLEKVEGTTAYVAVSANIETDGEQPGTFMNIPVNSTLKGTMKGNIKMDTTNAFLSEGEFTEELEGSLSVAISEEESFELPMKATIEMNYTMAK